MNPLFSIIIAETIVAVGFFLMHLNLRNFLPNANDRQRRSRLFSVPTRLVPSSLETAMSTLQKYD